MTRFKNACLLPLRFLLALVVYLLVLLGHVVSYIFREEVDGSGSSEGEEKDFGATEIESRSIFEKEEKAEVFLKFKFPTYHEFREESNTDVIPGSKYESVITSGSNPISALVDEPVTSPEDEKGLSDESVGDVFVENGNRVLEVNGPENEEVWTMDFTEMSEKVEQEEDDDGEEIQGHHEFLGESSPVTTDSDSNSNSESDSDSSSFENTNLMTHEFDANGEMEPVQNQDNDVRTSGDPLDEDEIELESLWEHQELVEQLKIELKKVRATGLPTILEESESPKIMDDLKPWKIDEFQRQDSLGELHKFYKSYGERMRKFDIINYQKMYTMGVLQLRDPLQFISEQEQKPPSLTLKSLLQQKLPMLRNKIHGSDPMKKFVQELQADLEAVYVAQMCISWEFLQWQYEKVLDLWDSDPRGFRRYNEVSDEFQQFQVLLQRFVEDEPFQDRPRIQNYVRTRADIRNLLQVPVVREDKRRGKKKDRKNITDDEYVITSDMLVEIVEESIRIFWRFVRADKDCTAVAAHRKMPEVSSPEDLKFLSETRRALLKKDRKLKDLLRSENCILKKFRQCREDDDTDQVLCFFAQVDMKLVCRVMNMARLTRDQLIWCHKKLDRIGFVDRKIFVEPAFLLFPG